MTSGPDPSESGAAGSVTGVAFPPLANATTYRPVRLDLRADPEVRADWLNVFRTHFVSLLTEFRREADERGADRADTEITARGVSDAFNRWLDGADADVGWPRSGNVLDVCTVREDFLRDAGIADPYRLAKREAADGCPAAAARAAGRTGRVGRG